MKDIYYYAALHELNGHFRCSDVSVEIGVVTQKEVDYEGELIQKYRKWLESQSDKELIKAYKGWLNYFEGRCREAQRAINKGARQRWEEDRMKDERSYSNLREEIRLRNFPRPQI